MLHELTFQDPLKQNFPVGINKRRKEIIYKSHEPRKHKYSNNSTKRSKISDFCINSFTHYNTIVPPNEDANWIPGIDAQTVLSAHAIPTNHHIDALFPSGLVSTLTNTSRSTSSTSQTKQRTSANGKQSSSIHNDNNSDSDYFNQDSPDEGSDENEDTPPKKPSQPLKTPEASQRNLVSVAHQMVDCLHECMKQQRVPTTQTVEGFMEKLKPWIPLVFTHNCDGNSRIKPKSKSTDAVPYYTVTIPIQSLPSTPPKFKAEIPPTPTLTLPTSSISHTTATIIEPLVPSVNKIEHPIPKIPEKELSVTPPMTEPQPKKRGRPPKTKQEQAAPSKPTEPDIVKSVPVESTPLPAVVQPAPPSPPIPKVSINPTPEPSSKRKQLKYQWLGEPVTDDGFGFGALQAEGIIYCLGDCVFMESGDETVPFIGVIVSFMQRGSKKLVGTSWFYRASDVPIFTAKDVAKIPKNELFTSPDYNENAVSMILKKVMVRHISQIEDLDEYSRRPCCFYYRKSWDPQTEIITTLDSPLDGLNTEDKSAAYRKFAADSNAPPAKIPKLVSVNHRMAVIEAFMKETVGGRSSGSMEEVPSKMEEEEEQADVRKKEEAKKESPRSLNELPPSTPQSEYGIPILENLIPEFPRIGKRTKSQPKKSMKPPSKTQSPSKRAISRPPPPQQQLDLEPTISASDNDDTPSFVPSSPGSFQKERKVTIRNPATVPASSLWKEVNSSDEYNRILSDASNKLIVREYYAVWCSPCIRARPKMEKLAENFKDRDIIFIRTDVDEGEDPGILNTSVKNLPTYTLVVGGKIVSSVVGTDEIQLTQAVELHLKQLKERK